MIVVSGEAVRYGGRVASVGAWVPSGGVSVLCFSLRAGLRLFFALSC
jgi:hypothetical protein